MLARPMQHASCSQAEKECTVVMEEPDSGHAARMKKERIVQRDTGGNGGGCGNGGSRVYDLVQKFGRDITRDTWR